MTEKQYAYSEIFYSVQGEGRYTGVPTAWLRFYMCNLQCNGFGQKEPTNPDTYELPYKDIDVSKYNTMEELPVFDKGCDSSYSWAAKFKPLLRTGTPSEIASRIQDSMKSEHNPEGLFHHPKSKVKQHMCFTGGEPLMPHGQECVVEVMRDLRLYSNLPGSITFETNGTQTLSDDFKEFFMNKGLYDGELFFSVSPKLFNVSGETREKAIKPENIKEYCVLSARGNHITKGQLKFVMTPHKEAWDELDEVVDLFRQAGVDYPVWIMPVGATVEGQKLVDGDVAKMAFERGYNVAARVHTYLWGNLIGV